MFTNDDLTIISGKVLEMSGRTISIAPGTRVELPSEYAGRIELGQRVLVRARRVKGRYVAESVRPEDPSTAPHCRQCGRLLTRNDLEDECEACHKPGQPGA